MKIAIIGPGAVGSLMSTLLSSPKNEIGFLGKKGPTTHSFFFSKQGRKRRFSFEEEPDSFFKKVEIAFFCLKAYHLEAGLEKHLPRLSSGIPLLFLGNGLIHPLLLRICEKFPSFQYRLGLTTHGVTLVQPQYYELRSQTGKILYGAFEPSLSAVSLAEKKLPLAFKNTLSIFASYKVKWLMNSTINPLVVYLGLEINGGLEKHLPTVRSLFNENFELGELLFGTWEFSQKKLWENLRRLLIATKENQNSLWKDFQEGIETELDFLLGPATAFPHLSLVNQILKDLKLQLDRKNKRKIKV